MPELNGWTAMDHGQTEAHEALQHPPSTVPRLSWFANNANEAPGPSTGMPSGVPGCD